VGDSDDGFLDRDLVAVATEPAYQPVVSGLEPAVDAHRGPGGLHEHGFRVRVAFADLAGLAFAGGLVVARA
jgi:hypothetical protein